MRRGYVTVLLPATVSTGEFMARRTPKSGYNIVYSTPRTCTGYEVNKYGSGSSVGRR